MINENTSAEQIGNEISDREKELTQSNDSLSITTERINILSKKILILRTEKKDLEITRDKGFYNKANLKLEISKLNKLFWRAKNAGL